jgi:hypothetical protein
MRNTEKMRRSAASNLFVQFPLAELTLQLAVDPSKSRRSIQARADGRSQQEPMVDPSKNRRSIPAKANGWSQQKFHQNNIIQTGHMFLSPDFIFPSVFSRTDYAYSTLELPAPAYCLVWICFIPFCQSEAGLEITTQRVRFLTCGMRSCCSFSVYEAI